MYTKLKKWIDYILPKFCIGPLIFTVVLNFSVYWGSRLIRNAFGIPLHQIGTSLDQKIPVWYPMVLIYFGCFAFWIVNYIYNARISKEHCYRFLAADWIGKAVCFIFYVVYPTTNIRPEIVGDGLFPWLMRFLYWVDTPDNLFPSIHCLVSWICYIGLRGNKKVPLWYRVFSCIFAILVFWSTLATRQHVIYDVIAGVALAEIGYFISGMIVRRHTQKISES